MGGGDYWGMPPGVASWILLPVHGRGLAFSSKDANSDPLEHHYMGSDEILLVFDRNAQEDVSGGERGRKLSTPVEDSAIALHIGDEVRVPFLRGARGKQHFNLTWGV